MARDHSKSHSRSPSKKARLSHPKQEKSSRDRGHDHDSQKRRPSPTYEDYDRYRSKRHRTPDDDTSRRGNGDKNGDNDDRMILPLSKDRLDGFQWTKKLEQERKMGMDEEMSKRRDEKRRVDAHRELEDLRVRREQREAAVQARTKERFIHGSQQETEQMKQWLAQEDDFVLAQAKKRAAIRIRDNRAKPIDGLVVNLMLINGEDQTEDQSLQEELQGVDFDLSDPQLVLEKLTLQDLLVLRNDAGEYSGLEKNIKNREFWDAILDMIEDNISRLQKNIHVPELRAVSTVAEDIDKLLGSKSFSDLEKLEKQILGKLKGDVPVDVDYWEQLLRSHKVWKAKAKLREMRDDALKLRLKQLREEQNNVAEMVLKDLVNQVSGNRNKPVSDGEYKDDMDPPPIWNLSEEDKMLEVIDEEEDHRRLTCDRQKVLNAVYIPMPNSRKRAHLSANDFHLDATEEDFTSATQAIFNREAARAEDEDDHEENFNTEATDIAPAPTPAWADKYRPRKPKYFNRVTTGYDWNKYNQTHYDHDNPPPKTVQGYKFNIFYPGMIDSSKAPTYRLEQRTRGGKKGVVSGDDDGQVDTCIIRFIAGPPYEDIAFRIVDKDWDYSSKRERGFKSSFDKGILQLHFQFKKVFYRK